MEELQPYLSLFNISEFGIDAFLLWIFALSIGVFLFYFIFFFSRLLWYKSNIEDVTPDPVSVIIASRNDAELLRLNLPMVMSQKNIDFEVIVVDDCSVDDTVDVLREYEAKYSNFKRSKLVENGEFEGGKKYAVTLGIKAAKHSKLVFIDADCSPDSDLWLRKMAQGLMYKKIILGYGPYKREKGFLNKLIRFDTYKIASQYLTFALAGIPYMGIGRNLAYQSYLYFDAKGFTSHLNVVSGDDDLFINEVANSKNTGIEILPETHVYSIPKKKYAEWEYQKRRHLTTAPKYKLKHKILLILFPISQYVLNISFLVLLILNFAIPLVLGLYIVKIIVQGIIQFFGMRRLKVLDLFLWSFVLELGLMLFYPWVSILNIVNEDQRKRWI